MGVRDDLLQLSILVSEASAIAGGGAGTIRRTRRDRDYTDNEEPPDDDGDDIRTIVICSPAIFKVYNELRDILPGKQSVGEEFKNVVKSGEGLKYLLVALSKDLHDIVPRQVVDDEYLTEVWKNLKKELNSYYTDASKGLFNISITPDNQNVVIINSKHVKQQRSSPDHALYFIGKGSKHFPTVHENRGVGWGIVNNNPPLIKVVREVDAKAKPYITNLTRLEDYDDGDEQSPGGRIFYIKGNNSYIQIYPIQHGYYGSVYGVFVRIRGTSGGVDYTLPPVFYNKLINAIIDKFELVKAFNEEHRDFWRGHALTTPDRNIDEIIEFVRELCKNIDYKDRELPWNVPDKLRTFADWWKQSNE